MMLKNQRYKKNSNSKNIFIFFLQTIKTSIDYYGFKKFIPERYYKKVWQDNQKFMFERHLYSKDFFKFIKGVTNALELPKITKENSMKGYYEHYDQIPAQTKSVYRKLIDIE